MSGPKCAQASLVAEREAELRRVVAQEAQLRQVRAQAALQKQQLRAARDELRTLTIGLEDLATGLMDRSLSTFAESERQTAISALRAAERAAAAIVASIETQSETVRRAVDEGRTIASADLLDGDVLPSVRRQCALAHQHTQQAVDTAARRQEEDRLRRTYERQRADAEVVLERARRHVAALAQLPRELLKAGVIAAYDQELSNGHHHIAAGHPDRALALARTVGAHAEAERAAVEIALRAWQEARDCAERAVVAVREELRTLDLPFIQTWARAASVAVTSELDALNFGLADLDTPCFALDPLKAITTRAEATQRQLADTVAAADRSYGDELRRRKIAQALYTALRQMGFNVGITLANADDPTSRLDLAARHPSGEDLTLGVALDQRIHLTLDDQTPRTDCVTEVQTLMAHLRDQGVILTMTDWGHVDPHRLPPAGAARTPGRRERADGR